MYGTIKQSLMEMKESILKEIRQSVSSERDDSKIEVGDSYDHATTERERELSLLLMDRHKEKLNQIDEALEKIEEGTYGICEECEKKIPLARLEAMPFAERCVKCKSIHEKQGKPVRQEERKGLYRRLEMLGDEDEN